MNNSEHPIEGAAGHAPMTESGRAELRAKAEQATPGPWFPYETIQADNFVVDERGLLREGVIAGPTYEKRNVQFIAAANPTTVLSLLDEVDQLRADLAVEEGKNAEYRAKNDSRLFAIKGVGAV